jgi:hypothetical protein
LLLPGKWNRPISLKKATSSWAAWSVWHAVWLEIQSITGNNLINGEMKASIIVTTSFSTQFDYAISTWNCETQDKLLKPPYTNSTKP